MKRNWPKPRVFASHQEWMEHYAQPVPEAGCWLFMGGTTTTGYGHINLPGQPSKAHRASYLRFYGSLPPGMCVCHTCDVPLCINPRHLFLGTELDNAADMKRKGRQAKRTLTHCRRGHLLEFAAGAGRNICKTCTLMRGRTYDAKRYLLPARRDAIRKAMREHMARKRAARGGAP